MIVRGTVTTQGILVSGVLRPHPRVVNLLLEQRLTVPSVSVTFMLDTGADSTCVAEDVVATAAVIRRIRRTRIIGVSGAEDRDVFPLDFVLSGTTTSGASALKHFWAPMTSIRRTANYDGLLGRDFLRFTRLTYDGPNQAWSIEIA